MTHTSPRDSGRYETPRDTSLRDVSPSTSPDVHPVDAFASAVDSSDAAGSGSIGSGSGPSGASSNARLATKVGRHFEAILRCSGASRKYARVLLATPIEGRYPFVYPRDAHAAVEVLSRSAVSPAGYTCANAAFDIVRSAAHFMKDVQGEDGSFRHRYTLEGDDASIYRHEVATAHGLAVLCRYLRTARALDKNVAQLSEFLDAIRRAIRYAYEHVFDREAGLFATTTSEHECAAESGFDLAANCAFEAAMRSASIVAADIDTTHAISRQQVSHGTGMTRTAPGASHANLASRFREGDGYVARIDSTGRPDPRLDVRALAPAYYDVPCERAAVAWTARRIDEQLADAQLGGLTRRHRIYGGTDEYHAHAGNGPSPAWSAILAQVLATTGSPERAHELLESIEETEDSEGNLSEHLTTADRFETFLASEWLTGTDAEKEFARELVVPGLPFDRMLAEVNRMAASYDVVRQSIGADPSRREPEGGRVEHAAPYLRAHVETLRAWLVLGGDWHRLEANPDDRSPSSGGRS